MYSHAADSGADVQARCALYAVRLSTAVTATVSHMTRRFLRQQGHSLNPLIGQRGGGCTTSHHM